MLELTVKAVLREFGTYLALWDMGRGDWRETVQFRPTRESEDE